MECIQAENSRRGPPMEQKISRGRPGRNEAPGQPSHATQQSVQDGDPTEDAQEAADKAAPGPLHNTHGGTTWGLQPLFGPPVAEPGERRGHPQEGQRSGQHPTVTARQEQHQTMQSRHTPSPIRWWPRRSLLPEWEADMGQLHEEDRRAEPLIQPCW